MTGSGDTGLEHMTGAEIAAAVDARKYGRGFHYRLLPIARKGAFSWFLLQYLLFFQVNLLLLFAIAICLFIFELRTNRFTMRTYSTHEIVELLMKRATLGESRNNSLKILGIGSGLWLAGFILCVAPAPFYLCHTTLFSGAFLMLCALKSMDQIMRMGAPFFGRFEAAHGRTYLQVQHSFMAKEYFHPGDDPWWSLPHLLLAYGGFALAMMFPFLVFLWGGLGTIEGEEHMFMIFPIVFSAYGCLIHEPARFHLVQRELDRLKGGAAGARGTHPLE